MLIHSTGETLPIHLNSLTNTSIVECCSLARRCTYAGWLTKKSETIDIITYEVSGKYCAMPGAAPAELQ